MDSSFDLLQQSFFGDQIEASKRLRSGETRLCHYTSAENAFNLLESKQFWLRNAKCMNDYSEITRGVELIANILRDNNQIMLRRLSKIIEPECDDVSQTFVSAWDNWVLDHSSRVFIGCLSECPSQETTGKLSMWRAYGSEAGGICFIFNPEPFVAETNLLGAYSLPVCYYDDRQVVTFLEQAISALESQSAQLANISPKEKIDFVVGALVFRAISLKHPGFQEEQEWRVVFLSETTESTPIEVSSQSINGVPQLVYKIPLVDDPSVGLVNADIPSLLHRVVIGPTNYPLAVYDALVHKLDSIQVENAYQKVEVSGIPLRLKN